MKKEFAYQVARVVATPLFKKYYNLSIYGKENIPEHGPIIFCGNHLHVLDQFPVIAATDKTIHWMAKKEYFDGKLGPLFEMTGAICVDRQGDSKKAEQEALKYLESGSAIGLFPEGTRNGLKSDRIRELYKLYEDEMDFESFSHKLPEDILYSQVLLLDELYQEGKISLDDYKNYILNSSDLLKGLKKEYNTEIVEDSILLPFKYGAVSMAQKTGVSIVPFAVTGEYKKNSDDLCVRFGEPFQIDTYEPLTEANVRLREKVKTLVYENKKTNKFY